SRTADSSVGRNLSLCQRLMSRSQLPTRSERPTLSQRSAFPGLAFTPSAKDLPNGNRDFFGRRTNRRSSAGITHQPDLVSIGAKFKNFKPKSVHNGSTSSATRFPAVKLDSFLQAAASLAGVAERLRGRDSGGAEAGSRPASTASSTRSSHTNSRSLRASS